MCCRFSVGCFVSFKRSSTFVFRLEQLHRCIETAGGRKDSQQHITQKGFTSAGHRRRPLHQISSGRGGCSRRSLAHQRQLVSWSSRTPTPLIVMVAATRCIIIGFDVRRSGVVRPTAATTKTLTTPLMHANLISAARVRAESAVIPAYFR